MQFPAIDTYYLDPYAILFYFFFLSHIVYVLFLLLLYQYNHPSYRKHFPRAIYLPLSYDSVPVFFYHFFRKLDLYTFELLLSSISQNRCRGRPSLTVLFSGVLSAREKLLDRRPFCILFK